jgi:predicted ATPase/class 3 adenylate cyclase
VDTSSFAAEEKETTMPDLPTGTVTFLFTDIEGSTRLWEHEPQAMAAALARHDALVREAIVRHAGHVFMTAGDAFCAAFQTAPSALAAACDAQLALANEPWTGSARLKARMALHTGVAEIRDNGYFGQPLNRVARLLAAGHGGQILLSLSTEKLVRDSLPSGMGLRDMGERRLKDLIRPERVYALTIPGLPADFPALKTLDARAQNLPMQLTSFVGREQEMDDVKRLLRSTRLVTLAAMGGTGKTRLSLQVGADLIDEYADGVWFIELAPLSDARLVPQGLATILGIKEQPDEAIIDTVVKKIGDREMLLILDNCEHLVMACAELCEALLSSCPGVRILASSRELLRIAGETAYRVPSLQLPNPKAIPRAASLSRFAAVRLFVDRALAVKASFQITDANAPVVASICQRLDGIPLAIELAAARLRSMSVEELNQRLDKRFHVLTGGSRTALPRQQTLRALIDWSYDLLNANERAMFGRLAVFVGGWALQAAEQVCAGEDVREDQVLDLLDSFVEKSLVIPEERTTVTRYRMLETVREYAQERLNDARDGDAVRVRHLDFYLALAEDAGSALTGPKQGAWLEVLDLERENLLAAHATCDRAENGGALGLRLVHALKRYWVSRGLMMLGQRVTVEALARTGARARDRARCRALFAAGQFGSFMGRYAEARPCLEESMAIAREIGDDGLSASITTTLALATLGQDDHSAARGYFDQGIALSRRSGNKRELAVALNGLAQLDRMEGALDAADALYRQSLALIRELGDRETAAVMLLNLAIVAIGRRSGARAREMLQEAFAISVEMQSKPTGQCALDVCAALAALGGDWARAARFFGIVEAQTEQTGYHRDPSDEAFLAPFITQTRTVLSADTFDQAASEGRALSYDEAIDEARVWLTSLASATAAFQ